MPHPIIFMPLLYRFPEIVQVPCANSVRLGMDLVQTWYPVHRDMLRVCYDPVVRCWSQVC